MDLLTSSVKESFSDKLLDAVNEEEHDYKKYIELSNEAETNKQKIILLDIAKEELRHKKFLQELLNDMLVK